MTKTLPDRRQLLALLGAGATITACGGIIPQAPPSNLYTLSPKTTFTDTLPRVGWQLVVEEPYAAGGLDTHRIVIMTTPYEVKYWAEARWTERAPRMVQGLLVESFENTRRIVSVGRQAVGLRSDFNLKTELREFQAELKDPSQPPQVRVGLSAKLIRQPRQEIVASAYFEQVEKAKSGAILDVVVAFDDALGKVLRESVQWTLITGNQSRA